MFYTSDIYSSEICQNSHSSVPSCWFMQNQSQIRRPHYNFQICCLFRLQCSVLHFNSIFLISLRKVFSFSFTQHFIIITMQWKFLSSLHTRLSISSIKFSCSVMSDFWGPIELQHARPHCPSPNPRVHQNPCALSRWYHPTISSSVVPFSSCPQSFPASRYFQMSQLFISGGQSIGVSASTSVLPMNTQDWSLDWTSWISLQSKGLSRVFSNTTVQKHQLFGAQLSL